MSTNNYNKLMNMDQQAMDAYIKARNTNIGKFKQLFQNASKMQGENQRENAELAKLEKKLHQHDDSGGGDDDDSGSADSYSSDDSGGSGGGLDFQA